MLEIQLDIAGYASDARLFGEVWNVHQGVIVLSV